MSQHKKSFCAAFFKKRPLSSESAGRPCYGPAASRAPALRDAWQSHALRCSRRWPPSPHGVRHNAPPRPPQRHPKRSQSPEPGWCRSRETNHHRRGQREKFQCHKAHRILESTRYSRNGVFWPRGDQPEPVRHVSPRMTTFSHGTNYRDARVIRLPAGSPLRPPIGVHSVPFPSRHDFVPPAWRDRARRQPPRPTRRASPRAFPAAASPRRD